MQEVNNLNNWARNTLNSRVGILDQAANLKRQTADLRSQIARLENAPKPAAVSAESQKLDEEALDIAREKNTANVERTQAVFDEKAAATDLKSEQQRSAETQNLVAKAAAEVEKLQASSSNSGVSAAAGLRLPPRSLTPATRPPHSALLSRQRPSLRRSSRQPAPASRRPRQTPPRSRRSRRQRSSRPGRARTQSPSSGSTSRAA